MGFHTKPNIFVSNVHLKVANLEQSLEFYKNVIGFQVLSKTANKADLTTDGKRALLTIEQIENATPKSPRTTGLYHYALLLPTRKDLGKVIQHFIDTRYPVQGASDHLVSEALYLADPDGNGIEIYSDRPKEVWQWQGEEVLMDTRPMDVEGVLKEAGGEKWTGLPAETVMGHIHLHVADTKETVNFYCEGLGFEVVCRYGGQAFFISTGKYHHHIGLNTWAGVGAPPAAEDSVGLRTFTLVLPDEESRGKTVEQLKAIGATVKEADGVITTKDPSKNRIVLQV
ncbi:glyoxalase [Sutcliffiella cohnii]|uniref:Glyoxalase n=1 Tax=Sutcliffiella cohnii TaxID=33932 RepID=A0A223KXC8_9BACI|nr:VOC family protein [Sutcliffiella cohnii]AST94106.1 glyoxalase [Sutcliffiella cohnii]